jgi:anti-sigma regulatory factor (Ser/Thr protein kinase)
VREVRRFVAESLGGVPEEQVEIILLAASELAANSVRHAGTAYTVTVARTDTEVRVTVDDDGRGEPEVQDPGPFTPNGRGLLIVEQLSDAWGNSSTDGHNRVWFAMRLSPSAAASSRTRDRSGGQVHERPWRSTRVVVHRATGPVRRPAPRLRASCRPTAPSATVRPGPRADR